MVTALDFGSCGLGSSPGWGTALLGHNVAGEGGLGGLGGEGGELWFTDIND